MNWKASLRRCTGRTFRSRQKSGTFLQCGHAGTSPTDFPLFNAETVSLERSGRAGNRDATQLNMNGFADHHLSEANFEPSSGGALRSFDAFPKTKQTYLTRASKNGGIYTGLLVLLCTWLTSTEVTRWFRGETRHAFSVERGVGHALQMNLDIVIPVSLCLVHQHRRRD